MNPREQHALGLESLARERFPLALAMLLSFLVGALPIEVYYYPQHLQGYLATLGVEFVLSWFCLLAVRRWPHRARFIGVVWATLMGLCILGYYPLVGADATLAMAALLCLISAMPAILPFGLWHQITLCGVCTAGMIALLWSGAVSALPWPYLVVSLLAVGSLSTVGASSLVRYRLEALEREAVLREAHENLRLALSRAESGVELRSRLVANVSHELRTPVNVIVGYADMVLDAVDDPRIVESLALRIRQYAISLDALVTELLDLSKLSVGKVEIVAQRVDLPRLLEDVANDTRLLTRGTPVTVVSECGVPEMVSDAMRLRQILSNLTTNAARATLSGRITISARHEGDWVLLAVTDTGCGIAPEQHARIFDAFEQAGSGSQGAPGLGLGLGLAIVRQITEVLGGTVGVVSEIGAGATFTIRLPVRTEVPTGRGEPPLSSERQPAPKPEPDAASGRVVAGRWRSAV